MNRKGDTRLYIGLATAVFLILAFISATNGWSTTISGIFVLLFIISAVFWKFTR